MLRCKLALIHSVEKQEILSHCQNISRINNLIASLQFDPNYLESVVLNAAVFCKQTAEKVLQKNCVSHNILVLKREQSNFLIFYTVIIFALRIYFQMIHYSHNKRAPGTPKRNTRKDEMIDWLIEKGVDFPPDALKLELWEIIKDQLLLEPNYDIDKLLERKRPDITHTRATVVIGIEK